jgi:hypothetical protein
MTKQKKTKTAKEEETSDVSSNSSEGDVEDGVEADESAEFQVPHVPNARLRSPWRT